MLKPDREYYLPRDASAVTAKMLSLIPTPDQEWFAQQGGLMVTHCLTDSLHRLGSIPYSAVSLWLYKSPETSPRFMFDVTHFMDSERAQDQTLHLSQFARQPLDHINQRKLVTEVGNFTLYGSFSELKFNHGVREVADGIADISPEYAADFQTIIGLNFGFDGAPEINTARRKGEIFLGGTIAFIDPMHPR